MSLFRRRSTRDLLGIQEIREHTIRTARGERSYFFLTPTNISVLSREGVAGRIQSLMEVLKSLDRAELICMDGSESFAENRDFLRRRYEAEPEPATVGPAVSAEPIDRAVGKIDYRDSLLYRYFARR